MVRFFHAKNVKKLCVFLRNFAGLFGLFTVLFVQKTKQGQAAQKGEKNGKCN